jgi:2-hydroxy-6-oxonona-2,4-dienedioate hydrolase
VPSLEINGGQIVYELLGAGEPLALTPGGRFSMEFPGVRPLAEELAEHYQVLLWDRPNTGKSDVKFTGNSESEMHADDLAALLNALDLAPAVLVGGSAGSRLSLVTAIRHPEVTRKLAIWWMSGGVFGTMYLAMNYILPVIAAALVDGMEAVVELPMWADTLAANPSNRARLLALDVDAFIAGQKRWLNAYIPDVEAPVPGLTEDALAAIAIPTLIFRSGREDEYHPESLSLALHRLIPGSELVDPPWGEGEWNRVKRLSVAGQGSFFDEWPRLAPQILEFLSRSQGAPTG